MATDTPGAPKPAKPIKVAAGSATPGVDDPAVTPAATTPRPAQPKKGPTVDATVKTATQTIKDNAAKLTKDAGGKARAYAEDGKARASGVLDELARMMTDAAGTVDEKVGAQYGQYARSAADAVSGLSDSIKAKDIDDLVEDARQFVKKSPAVAIGTAAAVGFVLVRLIKSGLDADRDEA